MNRILLTGATGFFGRALLCNFLSDDKFCDTTIYALSRNPKRFKASYPAIAGSAKIVFLSADIECRESLPWDMEFTHVLHAATDSTIGPTLSPMRRYQQIVSGTTNVLDLAVATGASRFLLTSSGGVYGPQPETLKAIPECWSGSPAFDLPSNSYSQAKRAAEYLCTLYFNEYGLQTVVARCFAFIGQDLPLDVHFAIGNFIRDSLDPSACTIAIRGDGSPLRTYLHQADLAYWLFTLLERGKAGHAYNVGSDEVVSIKQLACLVRDLLSPDKEVKIMGESQLGAARNRYIPDIAKIRSHLNLNVTIPLSTAIEEFLVRAN